MLPIICCLFLVLGQSLARPSADQYFDTLIHTALQSVIKSNRVDPTGLPDFTFEYQDKTFLGKVKGKAEYTKGSLTGLSSIFRSDTCIGPQHKNNGTYVRCIFSFSNLESSHEGRVKYGVLPKVTIHAEASFKNTRLDFDVIQEAGDQHPRLGTYIVSSVGYMTTTFTGLGPLNKHMKVLEENYKERVAEEVLSVLNTRFQSAVREAVKTVPLPQ